MSNCTGKLPFDKKLKQKQMKKIIFFIAFAAISCTVMAADNSKESSKNKGKIVPKTIVVPPKFENCASATNGVSSDCWSVEITATFCCDCEPVVASIGASIEAGQAAKRLVGVIELLNAVLPCYNNFQ